MANPGMTLGEQRFPQTYAWRALLAAAFLIPAALFIWMGMDVKPPDKTAIWLGVGLVAICAVVWMVVGRTVLTISDSGLRRESAFGSQELLWTQIRETRYFVVPINLAVHFGLIGYLIARASKSKQANLTLRVRGDGREIKITSNFSNAKEAIGIVLNRVVPPMVKEARNRIERGEKVQFGSLALSKTEIVWKGKTVIPVTEIQRAEIEGSNLRVKRNGKWLDAISVRSDKIPNVLVFLEVLDELAPQLKTPAMDPLARVRF